MNLAREITCSGQVARPGFSSAGQIRPRRQHPPDAALIHPSPARYGVKHTLSVVTFLCTLALLGLAAWTPKAEAAAPPTLADLQSAYPDLAGVVRAVEYVPCSSLWNNRTRPDCATTTGPKAEAEFDFASLTIRIANDITVSSWVVKHELAHAWCWSRWQDPSEACAAQVERGRR